MTLESLLLSRDAELMRVLRPTLATLAIEVEICQEARSAADMLLAEKFDAVIVDCDDLQGGMEVLEGLKSTPSNRNSVTFAILNGKKTTTQQAFEKGANFVLQKPISPLNASRCFHAALNFMLRERRRYFRQPVKMQVTVVLGNKQTHGTTTNISEGGIALMLHEALPKGAVAHLKFTLPETTAKIDVQAEMAWADIKGNAGFRFSNVDEATHALLETWLDAQMEKQFPAARDRVTAAAPEKLQ